MAYSLHGVVKRLSLTPRFKAHKRAWVFPAIPWRSIIRTGCALLWPVCLCGAGDAKLKPASVRIVLNMIGMVSLYHPPIVQQSLNRPSFVMPRRALKSLNHSTQCLDLPCDTGVQPPQSFVLSQGPDLILLHYEKQRQALPCLCIIRVDPQSLLILPYGIII